MLLRGVLISFQLGIHLSMLTVTAVQALEPEEVLVVINERMAGSSELANYYMEKRMIPKNSLVRVSLTLNETMTREEFDAVLKSAVVEEIEKRRPLRTEALVLLRGVPLKVEAPQLSWEESETLRGLHRELEQQKKAVIGASQSLATLGKEVQKKIDRLLKHDQRAAVDSELALVKKAEYPLSGWLPNPYFLGFQGHTQAISKDEVLLVARLDGPDEATVRRIIDDSIDTERRGLQGKAYFDARWPRPVSDDGLGGYQRYDLSLYRAADATSQRLPTVVDGAEELFPFGSCPDAGLYSGWYSLGRYVDSFTWNKGAIAYHIASSECTTLRDGNSPIWCVNLLKKGVAATIGPVHEPYVQGFPLPEIFFGMLLSGHLSLGEAYLVSLPYLSWQMVLVGDPLYRPFAPLP